jgi:DNA-binding IclR family transcriptional regulator
VSDDAAPALLALLRERDGVAIAAAAKRLALSQSELRRLLASLGGAMGGLGLVDVRDDDGRESLWLTDAGRRLCAK